jgi:hypothetical protein
MGNKGDNEDKEAEEKLTYAPFKDLSAEFIIFSSKLATILTINI